MRLGTLAVAVALLAAGGNGAARAADVPTDRPLTVEECVSIALARSPALGVAQAQVQSAEGARLSRWSGVLPRVSAGTSAGKIHANNQRSIREYVGTPVEVRSPAYDLDSYSYDLTASMSVLDWSNWRSLQASGTDIATARAGEEASHLYALLYPRRQPQERVYSILPLLAKHGTGLLETVYQNIHPGRADHQMLVV